MPHNWNFMPLPLLLFLAIAHSAISCPAQVQQLCHCVDEHDGVLLNCTQVDAYELVQVLRAAQAQIGLLKSLTIQDAKIPVLPDNFFAGLYIKRLELFHDGIQSIEAGAFSGLAQVLVELNLSGNKLTSLPVAAVAPLHLLQRLDFSNNSIAELQSIDALPRLPKLFDINLSRNLITTMHKSFFDNVKNSLQTINLGHNQLAEVPASALRGFRQLMALHIHNNQLRTLGSLSFMNLPILNLLNLASNRVDSIHRQAFLNVPQLRYLYMTDNHLGEILPHQFASFEQLEMIDLSNNRIEQLGEDSFSNLAQLRQLYLAENRITEVSPKAFTNSSVVILILESNQLLEVTRDMFQGAAKLQELSLKDNRIKSIDPNAFHGTPELVMIDLSHNELIDLAPSTFLPQLNMLLVDLSVNRLIRTPYSAFSRRVVTVLLQENPLVCTEKVHMLQQGVGVYMPNSEDKICNAHRSVETAIHDGGGGARPITTVNGSADPSSATAPETESRVPLQPSAVVPQEEANPFVQHPIAPTDAGRPLPIRPINIRPTAPEREQPIQEPVFINPMRPGPDAPSAHLPTSGQPVDSAAPTEHEQLVTGDPENSSAHTDNDATTSASSAESTTTGDGLDPNLIYPLPVPFLPKGPKKQPTAGWQGITETLPPSIVIAPRPRPSSEGKEKTTEPQASSSSTSKEETTQSSTKTGWERVEMPVENSVQPRLAGPPSDQDPYEPDDMRIARSSQNVPTAIIIVCLGTVAIVMMAVFVGMCVAKRRRIPLVGSSSSSTTARSNAYLSANSAAQLNAIYGTLPRSRGDNYARPTPSEDIYAWVCTPGMYNPYNK